MNGICLCIDRLHAGFVGAYGSTWSETPALDRAAADGFVFDQFHVDSLDVPSLYRSYWFGRHALDRVGTHPSPDLALAELLRPHGVRSVLMTDEPSVAALAGAEGFDQRILLPEPAKVEPAPSIEATHLGRAFAQIIQKLESLEPPFLLWCHLSSLGRVWDAPWEMRRRYAEADDPDPPTDAQVPCRLIHKDEDPDLLLGIVQSYAGQVSLLDLCVGALLDALAERGLKDETAVALMGFRGLALGEHHYVGPADDRLDGELVHVPLVISLPDPANSSGRSQALVQPPDLYPTWFSILTQHAKPPQLAAADMTLLIHEQVSVWRDRIGLSGSDGRRGLRTPAWYLSAGPNLQLFAKPDDRWEVNEVADRRPDVAEQLAKVLEDYEAQLSNAKIDDLAPLDELLRSGLE